MDKATCLKRLKATKTDVALMNLLKKIGGKRTYDMAIAALLKGGMG